METRQVDINSHLRNLKSYLLTTMAIFAGTVYFYNNNGDRLYIYCALGVLALCSVPVFTIHRNYYSHDKDKVLKIDSVAKQLVILQSQKATKIAFGEIESLTLTEGTRGVNSILTDDYFYFQIRLRDQRIFYLTSLLLRKNDLPFNITSSLVRSYPTVKDVERNKEAEGTLSEGHKMHNS